MKSRLNFRVAPLLLVASLTLGLGAVPPPAFAADPAKQTGTKQTKKPPAKKKQKSTNPRAAAAGTAVGGAAALALGTAIAPALAASADPGLRALEVRAKAGEVEAQMELADALTAATPLNPQDMRRAIYWYGQAAAKGDGDACWTLAELFRGDLGVPTDMEQAANWYTKAAERGHAEAAFDLGLLYSEGYGVERDTAIAARWFEQAADAGVARSLFMLGTLYEQGVDGAPDLEAARSWYGRAADAGDGSAAPALRRLDQGRRNVELADGPPPGMLGGPPGGVQRRPAGAAAASSAAPTARSVPVDQAGVKEIQTRLAKLGLHKGKADGQLGKRTVAAIRAYQKSVGLPVDGKSSQALLLRLRQG